MQNVVRELRRARAISQAQLGSEMGVSRQTINSIETGKYLPSLPLAMALARFFDATVEESSMPARDTSTRNRQVRWLVPVTGALIGTGYLVAGVVGDRSASGSSDSC